MPAIARRPRELDTASLTSASRVANSDQLAQPSPSAAGSVSGAAVDVTAGTHPRCMYCERAPARRGRYPTRHQLYRTPRAVLAGRSDVRRLASAISALSLAVLSGCGQAATGTSPSPHTTVTPSASTATTPPPLFALLEARHCAALEPGACENTISARHDTVAIAGVDGYAKAKSTFVPRPVPVVGNAATVLQLEAEVAAGAVYFIDGKGVVRRLVSAGTVETVATFPLTSSQQEVSFAVSPDGKQLMAAVLTFPTHHPSTDPNMPYGTFTGPFKLELEVAAAGGSTTVVARWQSDTNQYPDQPGGFTNIAVVSWDAQGPIALVHAATGTQNAGLNNQRWFFGASLVRLRLDGTLGPVIGPAQCLPYGRPVNGRFVCSELGSQTGTPVKVVSLDGTVLWSGTAPPAPGMFIAGDFAISPDGSHLAMDGQIVSLRDSSIVRLPDNFWPQGWLSNDTLIGIFSSAHSAGTLGLLHLSDPQHPDDWRFSGAFVGVLA